MSDRELTDTGEREAVRERAAEKLARAAATPPPVVTRDEVFAIAKEVFDREMPAHMRYCETDEAGPVCRQAASLDERIGKMDAAVEKLGDQVGTIQRERDEERGANREIAREAGKSAALRTVLISGAFAIAGVLVTAAINRIWPVQAHASTAPITQMLGPTK